MYTVWYYDENEELKEAPIERGRTIDEVAREYASYFGYAEIRDEQNTIVHSVLPI